MDRVLRAQSSAVRDSPATECGAYGRAVVDWLCAACAVEYPAGDAHPRACAICEDERQYVPPSGQSWTSLQRLQREGRASRSPNWSPTSMRFARNPVWASASRLCCSARPRATCSGTRPATSTRRPRPRCRISAVRLSSRPATRTCSAPRPRGRGCSGALRSSSTRPTAHWVQRDDPCIRTWSGRGGGASRGHAADDRRPFSRERGRALGPGRGAVRRHGLPWAVREVGDLPAELPQRHPAVRRGRPPGRRRRVRASVRPALRKRRQPRRSRMRVEPCCGRPTGTSPGSAARTITSPDRATGPATGSARREL